MIQCILLKKQNTMSQKLTVAAAVVQDLGKNYEAGNTGTVNGLVDGTVTLWQEKSLTGKALGCLGGNLL